MNAADLTVMLSEASLVLSRPSFQSLVTNKYISQDELSGQRFALRLKH
jgi:hypothetical protein